MRALSKLTSTLALTALALSGGVVLADPPIKDPGGPAQEADACSDPCDGELLWGPTTFVRETGKPITTTHDFVLPAAGDVCLLIANAGTTAAWISIDGDSVFAPRQFKRRIDSLTATVALSAGAHAVTVRQAGRPGSALTIELRACTETPTPLCSEVARAFCEDRGWTVVSEPDPPIGNIVCTTGGLSEADNCGDCGEYNIVVWADGSPEQFCPDSYSTQAGNVYGGHIPCLCADNLYYCGAWDMQGCVPD